MKIARTDRFKKAWRELSEEDRILARKVLGNMMVDLRYPSLRVKRIQGTRNIWEARISRSIRLTFEIHNDTLILRNIGCHDETLERP